MSLGAPGPRPRGSISRGAPRLEGAYHMPHNLAFPDELHLVVKLIGDAGPVDFRELVGLQFQAEVETDVFRKFHPRQHGIFCGTGRPSDYNSLVTSLESEADANRLVRSRREAFEAFRQRQLSTEEFLEIPYKPGRSWKSVWVEYPRDYLDFAVMLGLASGSSYDECSILSRGRQYLSDPSALDPALVGLRVDVGSSGQVHRIRPFWVTLTILAEAYRSGVHSVEVKRLMDIVSHLSDENDVPAAIREVVASRGHSSGLERTPMGREAQRFSLAVRRFLTYRGLAQESRRGQHTYLGSTRIGRLLVAN